MDNPAFVVDLGQTAQPHKSSQSTAEPTEPTFNAHTFEEAITLAQVGRFHYLLLLICGICFMSVMIEIMGVGIIMPFLKCDLETTITEQSILASACFLGIVLSSHAMGFLADTGGRVRTIRIALSLSAMSTIVSAFSVNIWMLIVFRFFTGFFIAGGQACVFSLMGEYHGKRTRVKHITLLAGFLPLALIYLPAISMLILPHHLDWYLGSMRFSAWRLLLLTNAMFTFLGVVGLFTVPETPKYALVQGRPEEALDTLRLVYTRNTRNDPMDYPVKRIVLESGGTSLANIHGIRDAFKMVWDQTVPLFNRERVLHTINISLFMFICYGISQGVFVWFPTILNVMVERDGSGEKVCELIMSIDPASSTSTNVCEGVVDTFMYIVLIVIGVAFTVFYLIFAYTIDYIGRKNLLIGWLVISGGCIAAIHWTSEFSVAVILLTMTMSIGNCGGIVGSIAMEFYPTNINAMGMCFIMMIGRLGAAVGSNFIGQLLFSMCDGVFWVILGVVCLLGLMSSVLPNLDKKNKEDLKH